jgi:hypothetical protein
VARVSHVAVGSWTMKSIAGVVLMTVCAVGAHGSGAEATRHSHQPVVESSGCRGKHEDGHNKHGDGDDDRGHDSRDDDRDHDNRGRNRGHGRHHPEDTSGHGLQQKVTVLNPATAFLRVDKAGRVSSAATNTGCKPSKGDAVFLLRPGGKVEQATTFDVNACNWSGNFTAPGRFQPQDCRIGHREKGR